MAVRYNISPTLNMILFVCEGPVTASNFLEVTKQIQADNRFRDGMMLLFDLLHIGDQFEIEAIQEESRQQGGLLGTTYQPTKILVLSTSTGLSLMAGNMQQVSNKYASRTVICYSLSQVIDSLELGKSREAIDQFWEESHA